jgi:hypothetical protein
MNDFDASRYSASAFPVPLCSEFDLDWLVSFPFRNDDRELPIAPPLPRRPPLDHSDDPRFRCKAFMSSNPKLGLTS